MPNRIWDNIRHSQRLTLSVWTSRSQHVGLLPCLSVLDTVSITRRTT